MCVRVCVFVYSTCSCVYVWAAASTSFLLKLHSQEVMKINERNGGGRLRSSYCLPVSGQSSIDSSPCSTLPASDKGAPAHTHTHTHTMCSRSNSPSLQGLVSNPRKGVKPPSLLFFYTFPHCLEHLKENVELTFHHCQIMPAEYGYFSRCELPRGDAFKMLFRKPPPCPAPRL